MLNDFRVMIVEDSETQALTLKALLEANGLIVDVALNGRLALKQIPSFNPQIIISDVVMPEMNGYDLCRELKKNSKTAYIPLILVTELSDPRDVLLGLASGADNFVIKPYDEQYLMNRIRYFMVNMALREREKVQMGIEIQLEGERHMITAARQQILDLLISTYEQGVRLNHELRNKHEALTRSNSLLNSLFHFSRAVAEPEDEKKLIETAIDQILTFTGVSGAWLVLRDINNNEEKPIVVAQKGQIPNDMSACAEHCLSVDLWQKGELKQPQDIEQCPALAPFSVHNHLTSPLILGCECLGYLGVIPSNVKNNKELREALNSAVQHLAIALGKARLMQSLASLVAERTKELREQQMLLQKILDNLPVGIFVADRNGKLIMNNPASERIWARIEPAERVADYDAYRGWWADTGEEIKAEDWAMARALRNGEICLNELVEIEAMDGTRKMMRNSGLPLIDDEGQITGGLVVCEDVSQQYKLDQELKLRTRALEDSNTAIIITDHNAQDKPIVYVNTAFERITGYKAAEVLGRNCRFLQGSARQQPELDKLRRALSHQESCEVVLRNFRKDGSEFFNELRLSPVRDKRKQVTHYIGVINDITERLRYEQALERKSGYDELTGLLNRNLLSDRIKHAIDFSKERKWTFVIGFINICNFKLINETYGHHTGDEVLRNIAEAIQQAITPEDSAARLGGDTFVVLINNVESIDEAIVSLNKIRTACNGTQRVDNHEIKTPVTIGFTTFPGDGEEVDELMRNADTALYETKHTNKGGIGAFKLEMTQTIQRRLVFEQDIKRALANNEFELYFQPQTCLRTGRVDGFEALIRWNHEGTVISPVKFIPLAEELGLIQDIDHWVIEHAAEALSYWKEHGYDQLVLSINLSSDSFQNEDIVPLIEQSLRRFDIPGSMLKIEVTESSLIGDKQGAIRTMNELKKRGILISLDDFGTGYASMSYLQAYPFDQIKIDKSFVSDIHRHSENATLSRSIIMIGHTLSMTVIAEGVETEEQLTYLAFSDCDYVQGYLISRPIPFSQTVSMLSTKSVSHKPDFDAELVSRTVLILSRRHEVLQPIRKELIDLNYVMRLARHPDDIFKEMAKHRISTLLIDIDAEPESVHELLRRLRAIHPYSMRIVVCSAANEAVASQYVQSGLAHRYQLVPFDTTSLRHNLKESSFLYKVGIESEKLRRQFEARKS